MSILFYSQFNILPYFDKKDRLKTNEVGPEIAGTCPLTKKDACTAQRVHPSHATRTMVKNLFTRRVL